MNSFIKKFIPKKSRHRTLTNYLRIKNGHYVQRTLPTLCFLSLGMMINLTAEAETLIPETDLASLNQSLISGDAFSGTQGVIAVNQAAGYNNLESNRVSLTTHSLIPDLDDDSLSQVGIPLNTSNDQASDRTSASFAYTSLSRDAFAGSRGVVQVNQVSGTENILSNRFRMQPLPDTHQK